MNETATVLGNNNAFYFTLKFSGDNGNESSFQEITGLSVTLKTEKIKEGGQNRFIHRVPTPPKYKDLVLKRGLIASPVLINWCKNTLENVGLTSKIEPKEIQISLRNAAGENMGSWQFTSAYPISWEIASLSNTSNALLIETLTLSYAYFERTL
ncbi:hypothetical protein LPB136_03610 [Tenacibaculum todarodis]|uniref:Phage tail protein n=1 Tax=Tenacibaculum todarodis TaxID=1850252 RepID=A0A1L3JH84_9FLAO|nr:phage tail protein [Tenacibaculum todarodis]APG64505.1 hypothetical protein LPB136_03610 [Tenacibaculum todarodis]